MSSALVQPAAQVLVLGFLVPFLQDGGWVYVTGLCESRWLALIHSPLALFSQVKL